MQKTIGEQAYELRESGLLWPRIGAIVYGESEDSMERYRDAHRAMMAAKSFAIVHERPWPPGG